MDPVAPVDTETPVTSVALMVSVDPMYPVAIADSLTRMASMALVVSVALVDSGSHEPCGFCGSHRLCDFPEYYGSTGSCGVYGSCGSCSFCNNHGLRGSHGFAISMAIMDSEAPMDSGTCGLCGSEA